MHTRRADYRKEGGNCRLVAGNTTSSSPRSTMKRMESRRQLAASAHLTECKIAGGRHHVYGQTGTEG
jgi:hypothetical protein